jgi:2-polyprenyl-3-methyl-5-hydroxy-6-metoxy-1,4-benzoquinol methylase
VACALCGSAAADHELEARDWLHGSGESFCYVRCCNCGLVYLNPRPAPAAIGRYYPRASYYTFQLDGQAAEEIVRPAHRQLARQLTQRLGAGRAFDVGCGDGSFLLALRERGWQPSGIEFDRATVAALKQRWNLSVAAGDFLAAEPGDSNFDLVSMLEVLEHLHQPLAALKRARDLLRPGGTLYVTVPNLASLEYRLWRGRWVALEPPLHLYHFTSRTLTRALHQVGLQVQSVESDASTAGLTRSLWLKVRPGNTSGAAGGGQYQPHSWRRTAHSILNTALSPLGSALKLAGLGPGLRAMARRPA